MENFVLNDKIVFTVREYNNERVLPFFAVDILHGKESGTTYRNFQRNKKHFLEGIDYYYFSGNKGKKLLEERYNTLRDLPKSNNFKFHLLTFKGYLNICKCFYDDLSWDIQKRLVDYFYYSVKNNFNTLYDGLRALIDKLEQQDNKMSILEIKQEENNRLIEDITCKMITPIAEGAITPMELAQQLEIYSKTGNPHTALICDICNFLNIKVKYKVIIPQETKYTQFRLETQGNVQVVQCYLKLPAQDLIKKWWNEHKEDYKTIEYYKVNTKTHMKGDVKDIYYLIGKSKRYILLSQAA